MYSSAAIIVSALAALATANPFPQSPAQQACPVGGTPQCCQLDVLQLADVTCRPPKDLSNVKAFQDDCASKGETAQCCVLPVIGQALLCQQPAGGPQNSYPSAGSNVPAGGNQGGNYDQSGNQGGNGDNYQQQKNYH